MKMATILFQVHLSIFSGYFLNPETTFLLHLWLKFPLQALVDHIQFSCKRLYDAKVSLAYLVHYETYTPIMLHSFCLVIMPFSADWHQI